LKLIRYEDLTFETWFVIIGAFISYFLGIITFFVAKNNFGNYPDSNNKNLRIQTNLFINNAKVLKISILITSIIGLIGAIQNWLVLLHEFKTFPNIIINANIIYHMRVEGELAFVPYLSSFSYVAVFLGALYSARKGKISFYLTFPFLGVILSDLANVGRAGMLFAFVEFISALVLYSYSINKYDLNQSKRSNKKFAISIVLIFISLVAAATVVKSIRGSVESISSSTSTLNKLKGNAVITPTVYLYFSSDVGVLNKYLELEKENSMFGENTFMPIYRVLNKLDLVEKPQFYQTGYYIPMWTNTGTYLRELHADFGVTGILLVPFLLGLFITFLWFKFFETTRLNYLVILVYFYIIIFFSFVVFEPRQGYWIISLVLILLFIPALEKLSLFITR
jgi:oligosaccharide repeat unit polymerase